VETPLTEVDELSKTQRDNQGFGSTGAHAVVLKKEINELEHSKEKLDKHSYQLGPKLTEKEKEAITRLIGRYEDVFAVDFEDIKTKDPKYVHDIEVNGHRPIRQHPYRTPLGYRNWVAEEIKQLENNGIIRKSSSPWASPIVIVAKKGMEAGQHAPRLCIDYRKVNDVTIKDSHPIPLIDDILQQMGDNANYITTLDLFSGYFQLGLTPRAQKISAFVTTEGIWEWQRMPFGLCNAPASFQRMMNGIFGDLIGKSVLVYLD
jgi:hypothetical protein